MAWHDTEVDNLTPLEAFDAMQEFLKAYWERGGKTSDEIAALLSDISRNTNEDLPPVDVAQWTDFLHAIGEIKRRRLSKRKHN
jgi:hypothetical protein